MDTQSEGLHRLETTDRSCCEVANEPAQCLELLLLTRGRRGLGSTPQRVADADEQQVFSANSIEASGGGSGEWRYFHTIVVAWDTGGADRSPSTLQCSSTSGGFRHRRPGNHANRTEINRPSARSTISP